MVSVAKRPWHLNNDSSNVYGFTPNFPCCISNMHSPWPRYVEYMWLATADKGLVSALYGPGRVEAKVGEGSTVEITEETEYPFSDRVRMTIRTSQPVSFPIYFRIPAWADGAELSVAGALSSTRPQGGTLFKVDRVWKSGDVVTLDFHFKVRAETRRRNNAVVIARGPLYFVLRIGEAFQKIPPVGMQTRGIAAPPGCVDWHIAPTTDWNYALAIDRNNPQCEIITGKLSSMPFAQKGEPVRLAGATDFTPWPDDVPIALKVKARQVPGWGMNGANAAPVPVSPVKTNYPETSVELIPYGCSRLRITEFPTV